MEGKVVGIWTLEFRLIRDVLAGLLNPAVPATGGKHTTNYRLHVLSHSVATSVSVLAASHSVGH